MKKHFLLVLLIALVSCENHNRDDKQELSASMYRYKTLWQDTEPRDNEFYTSFSYYPIKGLGYEEGISRRDPSTIIKVGGNYYVYYTRSPIILSAIYSLTNLNHHKVQNNRD